MTPKEFVMRLQAAVVDENYAIYRDLFMHTSIEKASDPYWKRALALYNSFSLEQKEVFFEVIHQISVDTVSNILGVIDGVNSVEGIEAELVLKYDDEEPPLSGDLQSLFLTEEEKREKMN